MASQIVSLEDLGPRICILGPSNSGKSTLATAIAQATNRKAIYLDQLAFVPNSDWVMKSKEEFFALHDEAIKDDYWVIEGNYLKCFPQRLERATSVILLENSPFTCLWRYFRRCWFEKGRIGALEGGQDTVKWEMIRYIMWDSPQKAPVFRKMFEEFKVPKVKLSTQEELDSFYHSMNLTR